MGEKTSMFIVSLIIGFSFVIRPTSVIIWIPLMIIYLLNSRRNPSILITHVIIPGYFSILLFFIYLSKSQKKKKKKILK